MSGFITRLRGFGLAAALVLLVAPAMAETPPSAWDRAKQPEVNDEYQLHLTAQRMLHFSDVPSDLPLARMLEHAQYLRVFAMLQSANAETSTNPLLRFDLAYAYAKLDNHARAVAVYKAAMKDFPQHRLSRESRFELAISCGYIGDHECEARMYRDIIAAAAEPEERSTPMLNLAETEMHNRDLREAIEGYREVYRLCGSYQSGPITPALALWGLAVALDRAGEIHEAETTAFNALSTAQNHAELLTSRGIFFFPEYEVHWYQAITAVAEARHAQNRKDALMHWQNAERLMEAWVNGGEKKKDYWLPIAKTRLATYKAERIRAEKELLKEPPPSQELDGFTLTL